MIPRMLTVLTATTLLAACTSSGGSPSTSPAPSTRSTAVKSTPPDTGPVDTGPTRAATATACPFADQNAVRNTIGMRLGRITVLRSGGHVVGCRFYALQNSPLHVSEHLPGPKQPAVEITTRRYASPTAAHNAFVLLAEKGANVQQIDLGRTTGLCFQTNFYPKDHGKDWACAASVRTLEVVVRSVDTTGTFSTASVTRTVLRRV